MKLLYTLSIVILSVAALLMLAETFAVVSLPLWLSQINGLLILTSLFTILGLRVRMHSHAAAQVQPVRVRGDR